MARKGGLGKGLDALFLDNSTGSAGTMMNLRIGDIEPNKEQPRDRFDRDALEELAESIKEHGLIQPIVVRATPGGSYQIIAGERRWRACRIAGLAEVPAVIVEADEDKTLQLALIENLQRENLTPIEEAKGYRTLMERFGMTQEQVAAKMGKSRPAVANSVRLLNLPKPVLEAIDEGSISAGHAKVLAGMSDPQKAAELAKLIVEKGLTVRQTEKLAKDMPLETTEKTKPVWGASATREIELSLAETMGRRVKITRKGDGGDIKVPYFDEEDLKRLVELLGKM